MLRAAFLLGKQSLWLAPPQLVQMPRQLQVPVALPGRRLWRLRTMHRSMQGAKHQYLIPGMEHPWTDWLWPVRGRLSRWSLWHPSQLLVVAADMLERAGREWGNGPLAQKFQATLVVWVPQPDLVQKPRECRSREERKICQVTVAFSPLAPV